MGFLNLFIVALMPVLKVILITGVGLFIALDRIKLLGPDPNRHLNDLVFYVLSPALAATSLAETVTFRSFITLWFMPLNLLLAFVFGSLLAWFLIKITKTPKHLQGIVIGCCSAGNVGNLPLIMIPAVCEESNSPFGDPAVCSMHARPYASLSLAIGAIYIWSYVYGVMRLYINSNIENGSNSETLPKSSTELVVVPSSNGHNNPTSFDGTIAKMSASKGIMQRMKIISGKVDLKKVFAPTAIAAIVGFIIGIASPIRKLLIGNKAPLRVIDSSAYILGEATVPCMTLIMGANLLKGLKGSDVSRTVIIGIIGVRNILLPLMGIGVVKAALQLGLVASDNKLYQFVLMLQFAVPPAMAIGTMTQFFQLGQCETSVIMMWTYVVAAFTLTLWSTLFMWILA
ncbi:Auxin efflux carrier family protein isoform 1 [Hibiscus syriacus]|uniref:Auxin efflux carrier family protein isoform 1 n=1 Tax=Hibiscus syriacus TaxID=106335 RepID=A0A6A3BFR1_HIBSY|nr:protein PIN-LIKES 3-like [Hibiscus syriacus]KAE8713872.1 Auxin efflux carrier family protein isoform 1 [Hibiscus syriacus]